MTAGLKKHGEEFKVNTFFDGGKGEISSAGLADGGYVIFWTSSGQTFLHNRSVFGQRYDAAGNPIGSEIEVDHDAITRKSSVVGLDDGGFVVTYLAKYGTDYGYYFDRYNAAGEEIASAVQIPTGYAGTQSTASISALSDGGFIIAWQSLAQGPGYQAGMYIRRFDSDGNPTGAEEKVTSFFDKKQRDVTVTAKPDGGYVVVWETEDLDGSGLGIFGQNYGADGAKTGAVFAVNSFTTGDQRHSDVVALSNGGFVVTWESFGQDSAGSYGVYAQLYDSSGTAIGSEFAVNAFVENDQAKPSITAMPDGGFVIVWESATQDGSAKGVYAQRFDALGEQIGDETLINTYTVGHQKTPVVTALENGGFVVSWISVNQDGAYYGVYAQQFDSQLFGTREDDLMVDSIDANWLDGRAGNDDLSGLGGNDWMYGRDGDDVLYGGLGQDKLFGGSGDDRLIGGGGGDRMKGGKGDDTLMGGAGNDRLIGGAGKDVMNGGAKADTFIFRNVLDSTNDANFDRIVDFEVGVDHVDISHLSATDFSFIGADGFSGAGPEVQAIVNGAGNTIVRIDVDGDGLAEMRIFFTGDIAFTADDFIL